jgi:hypothetical protein
MVPAYVGVKVDRAILEVRELGGMHLGIQSERAMVALPQLELFQLKSGLAPFRYFAN